MRVLDDEVMTNPFILRLVDKHHFQGWDHLFRILQIVLYKEEVVEFYVNLKNI